ncbi:MAG: hypothetical protein R3F23_00830 [Verrucomicrobiia bacterium]
MGWTSQDALDFTTLQNFGSGALDGNNPANRVLLTSSIGGLNIPPGESFWIRWADLMIYRLQTKVLELMMCR